jgi:thymidine kinase
MIVKDNLSYTCQMEKSIFKVGRLEVIFGPMFSGKTVELLFHATRNADLGYKVLYINYQNDNREDVENHNQYFSTHSSSVKILSPKIDSAKTGLLSDLDVEEYDFITVDEGNFYPDLNETVMYWVNTLKKVVLIAALDGDYTMNNFGKIIQLLSKADDYRKLKAQCIKCIEESGNVYGVYNAPFTKRINSENTNQISIGGKDQYMAVCRYHYNV